jgi:hypothetical protein
LDPEKFTLLSGDLHLLAFKAKQGGIDAADRWSEETLQMLLSNGFMLSRPFYGDRFCLKAVFGNPHTRAQHLSDLSDRLNASLV